MLVRPISAVDTHALRRLVLRDNRPDADVIFPGDDAPGTLHLGAFAESPDQPLAILTLMHAPLKDQAFAQAVPLTHQWQFRGMASHPSVRGQGFGHAVMRACIQAARDRGAALLWCNARHIAIAFYARFALLPVGPSFDIPGIGPHTVMTLRLNEA
jgi:GNAT superfamily N-acetyltransferase